MSEQTATYSLCFISSIILLLCYLNVPAVATRIEVKTQGAVQKSGTRGIVNEKTLIGQIGNRQREQQHNRLGTYQAERAAISKGYSEKFVVINTSPIAPVTGLVMVNSSTGQLTPQEPAFYILTSKAKSVPTVLFTTSDSSMGSQHGSSGESRQSSQNQNSNSGSTNGGSSSGGSSSGSGGGGSSGASGGGGSGGGSRGSSSGGSSSGSSGGSSGSSSGGGSGGGSSGSSSGGSSSGSSGGSSGGGSRGRSSGQTGSGAGSGVGGSSTSSSGGQPSNHNAMDSYD